MSLVAYDSSSEEEEEEVVDEAEAKPADDSGSSPTPLPPPPPQSQTSQGSSRQHLNAASPLPTLPLDELPDAAFLLASPTVPSQQTMGTDHSSRVTAAMVENASRKRESNGSALQNPRNKYPRGQLAHLRSVNTTGGTLIPPQLSGRSNVVTEDINKLFVRRSRESSS
ncbi:uncharacterized protein [Typha latifolia]|uniref:uncharacterized protein n=1 Tax=Typha latifolia TaxID=4733 RepID=UPI003C2D3AD2